MLSNLDRKRRNHEDGPFGPSPETLAAWAEELRRKNEAEWRGVVNLTPHAVCVVGYDGAEVVSFPPSGTVARMEMFAEEFLSIGGIPLMWEHGGPVSGLPAAAPGRYYIVSALVRLSYPSRTDLISPTNLVRDEAGRVVACRAFAVNVPPDFELE